MDYAVTSSPLSLNRAAARRGDDSPCSAGPGLDRRRDAAWVTRALQGDEQAFRALVEHYQDRAFRVALGVMGHREEAWDVAQEAFLRVYRSLHRFQRGQSFYTWLYRIVVNLSIDAIRKRSQGRAAVALEDLGDAVGLEDAPGVELDREETRQRVRAVLDRLPPPYRAVLVLRDIEDVGCWEIARIVGCTHATARWRLHKARKMFRESWERHLRRSEASWGRADRPPENLRSRAAGLES